VARVGRRRRGDPPGRRRTHRRRQLERELLRYADRPLRIGSFSAAGIVTDTHAISALLHCHGALSFWDFAAAAPYVDIEMYGGPERELLRNRVPDVPGGGTVAYVNPSEHRYLDDPAQREEGGTPAIVEAIRAGLVFQLKQAVGHDVIRSHEEDYLRRALSAWAQEPSIEILGNLEAERLSIVSFVVRAPSGRYLHHNFVVSLLNDLFGIQSRGGCSCAGPYGRRLLGIDLDRSHEFDREIAHGCESIKPGWVRVNFNYFISEAVFSYIVEAVRLVAKNGWRLLGDYRFEPAMGLWRHRHGPAEPPLRLAQVTYDAQGSMRYPRNHERAPESELQRYVEDAKAVLAAATPASGEPIDDLVSADFEHLRWFDLPAACLAGTGVSHTPPGNRDLWH